MKFKEALLIKILQKTIAIEIEWTSDQQVIWNALRHCKKAVHETVHSDRFIHMNICLSGEIPCSFTASLNFRTGCCCRLSRDCVTELRIRQDGFRHTATVLLFPSAFGSVWRLGSVTNSSISLSPAFELCKPKMHVSISIFYWIKQYGQTGELEIITGIYSKTYNAHFLCSNIWSNSSNMTKIIFQYEKIISI